MSKSLKDVDVSFDKANGTAILSKNGRSVELLVFDSADAARLMVIADRICKQKRRERTGRTR